MKTPAAVLALASFFPNATFAANLMALDFNGDVPAMESFASTEAAAKHESSQ